MPTASRSPDRASTRVTGGGVPASAPTSSGNAPAAINTKARAPARRAALALLAALQPDAAKAEATAQKLQAARDKYADEAKEIMKEAQAKDVEQKVEEKRALRFDIGEGLLELGLVLCSLFFLARKRFFPIFGVIASIAGTTMGIWGWVL